MKKILLSLILLCTAMSAWSYTTTSVTKYSTDGSNGIITTDGFMIYGNYDKTSQSWTKGLAIGYFDYGHIITSVKFTMLSGTIDKCECENWKFDEASGEWVQDGTFAFYGTISFSSNSDFLITSVTVTYHKHTCTKNTDYKAATCTETGMKESWKCSDCGHIYYDERCKEVAKSEDLVLLIDPTKHASTLEKVEGVAATCVSKGKMEYWHCKDCNHCFEDETGQKAIAGDIVTTDINPDNHGDKLKEVAYRNASVVEDGVLHHWHCQACGNDYADASATKSMSVTVKAKYDADALLIGSTTVDESYLFNGAEVTFDDDNNVNLAMGSDNHQYELSETERLAIDFSHTFKLTANQDPKNTSNYYSTFFTSEGAYKVPETTKAYIGEVVTGEENDVLKLSNVGGIIHQSEAVILKATENSITLMPSCNKVAASTENVLEGTDEPTTLGANQYALSLGQNGVGFYLWNGKAIGANKAYLTLYESNDAKALVFDFEDEPTGIEESLTPALSEGKGVFNLNGIRVDGNYKGIVIKNGKKVYQK